MTNRAYFLFLDRKATRTRARLHVCCTSCSSKLNTWVNCKGCSTSLVFSMVWREPTNHRTNCYFCMMPPIQKWVPRRKGVHWSTQIYLRSFVQYLTVKVCLFQKLTSDPPLPPNSFSIDCDNEEENTPEETAAIYFKRSGIFPERNLSWAPPDHAERNFWPHQRPRPVYEKGRTVVLRTSTVVSCRWHRASNSISLPPKTFWAIIHNTRWT